MKAEGKKLPSGRKPGAAWITPGMRRKREAEAAARATEAERPAAMSPFERQRQAALKAIAVLQERLKRTGSLYG